MIHKAVNQYQQCVNKYLGKNTVFLTASEKSISSLRWIYILKECKNVLNTSSVLNESKWTLTTMSQDWAAM